MSLSEPDLNPSTVATSARTCLLPRIPEARELGSRRTDRNTIYEAAWRDEILGAFCVGRRLRFRRETVLMWAGQGRLVPVKQGSMR